MALTAEETKAIEDGRTLIDQYRTDHAKIKPTEQATYLGKLLGELFSLKLSDASSGKEIDFPFFVFYEKSMIYNYEALGYTDKDDFDTNASAADKTTIETMWK